MTPSSEIAENIIERMGANEMAKTLRPFREFLTKAIDSARKEAVKEAVIDNSIFDYVKNVARKEAFLKAAGICIETWKKADNHLASDFRQNRIADGCVASAEAIRAEAEAGK